MHYCKNDFWRMLFLTFHIYPNIDVIARDVNLMSEEKKDVDWWNTRILNVFKCWAPCHGRSTKVFWMVFKIGNTDNLMSESVFLDVIWRIFGCHLTMNLVISYVNWRRKCVFWHPSYVFFSKWFTFTYLPNLKSRILINVT